MRTIDMMSPRDLQDLRDAGRGHLIDGGRAAGEQRFPRRQALDGKPSKLWGHLVSLSHGGGTYSATGKIGVHRATGKRVAEYRDSQERGVWADRRGRTYPD